MLQQLKPLPMDTRGRAFRTSCVRERGLLFAQPSWTPSSTASHPLLQMTRDRRVRGALSGPQRSCQGLPAAAESPQMPWRCLRPRGASGGAGAAAVGAGSRVTPPAAMAHM